MHTASHLVKNALSGEFAEGRTIILVTHHITLCLPIATYLVELASGKVIRQGTVDELQNRGQLDKVVKANDSPVVTKRELQHPMPDNEADAITPEVTVNGKATSKPRKDGKLVEAEARAEGRVSLRTYATYIKAAGVIAMILTLFFLIELRLLNVGVQV